MGRVVEIAKQYASASDKYTEWLDKKDGASLIADEKAWLCSAPVWSLPCKLYF